MTKAHKVQATLDTVVILTPFDANKDSPVRPSSTPTHFPASMQPVTPVSHGNSPAVHVNLIKLGDYPSRMNIYVLKEW
jgi:hypothetical protein